ncbi:raffinose/stachyose/melibiose transport system substrate-binding protein [Anaerocolumna jejuensis DSM 15929]|uniref:Raffinose/stachyose/melibiose transport system substrate-binding protein n=1 Tax=Anaerocolumna jejuensis DSM 15929 TaxID=1121322 RepID=A0A1M6X259_9FIRM|nr:extracellular solute-binding protein [Anaerocolumna jejuensis]SHK99981.1 raffinose/stachyose/melibiose transport system substrate-binding protein [Anaerocolumna jejuensis DSM 15929]
MKHKKVLALALTGVLVLSALTGCKSSSSGTETKTDSKGNENAAKDNITITMMYSGTTAENDFETEVLPKLVHEAFPNITLEVTKLPDDQYYTSLKTKLASGECPDMILVQPKYAGANSVIGLAKAGYLAPLTDLKIMEKVGGAGLESFNYNGEVYGVPGGVTILGTYYNKDVFKANGLSVPTNWEEFLNVCETLKKAGIQPIVMGDKDMYVMQFGLYQLAANVVYPSNPSFDDQLRTGETKFTDKGIWDKTIEMYKTLYDKGYIASNSLGLGAQQAIQKFVDGEAAMTFDGSFNAAAIQAEGAVSFERGYFPLPGNETGKQVYASMAMGAGPAIYSGSKHIDECKAILEKWFDGESDIYKAYADSGKVIVTYGYGSDKVNPLFKDFLDLYNKGNSFYWCNQGWPAGTENEMETLFSESIGGQKTTVEDIVKGMQSKFEELNTEK